MKYICVLVLSLICVNSNAKNIQTYQDVLSQWDYVKFSVKDKSQQKKQLNLLDEQTDKLLSKNHNSAELWALSGLIKATKAELYKNIESITLLRESKDRFEKSIKINPRALNAAATTSLAALYYKTPYWPIGIKDYSKANELIHQALKMYPKNVEVNYFYAEYLIAIGDKTDAKKYYKYALEYPIRKDRYQADIYRKKQLKETFDEIYQTKAVL